MTAAASSRLSLPVDCWPELDHARWSWALQPGGFLEPDKPASQWSPARRRIVEQAYGQWLAFLDRGGMLDPACAAADRATKARLRAFVTELQGRVAPASVSQMVGGLLRMFAVLAPEGDWAMLARVYSHLKQTAAPSRDKISRLVAAGDLFELGIRVMDTCETGPRHPAYVATKYRDGLCWKTRGWSSPGLKSMQIRATSAARLCVESWGLLLHEPQFRCGIGYL